MSSFFRNIDGQSGMEIGPGPGRRRVDTLRARAIPIDMEVWQPF